MVHTVRRGSLDEVDGGVMEGPDRGYWNLGLMAQEGEGGIHIDPQDLAEVLGKVANCMPAA